MTVVSSKSWY